MDATYDQRSDTFVITFGSRAVIHSGELTPGIIADYDNKGAIIRLEFLDASKSIVSPGSATISFHFSVE